MYFSHFQNNSQNSLSLSFSFVRGLKKKKSSPSIKRPHANHPVRAHDGHPASRLFELDERLPAARLHPFGGGEPLHHLRGVAGHHRGTLVCVVVEGGGGG